MRTTQFFAPAVLASVIVLAGCTSTPATTATPEPTASAAATPDAPSAAATPDAPSAQSTPLPSESEAFKTLAPPAADGTIAGTGYSFKAPQGWQRIDVTGVDLALQPSAAAQQGSAIAVLVSSTTGTLDEVEAAIIAQAKNTGIKETTSERVTVDGAPASHLAFTVGSGEAKGLIDYLIVVKDGKQFTTTITNFRISEKDAAAMVAQIQNTWKWQ